MSPSFSFWQIWSEFNQDRYRDHAQDHDHDQDEEHRLNKSEMKENHLNLWEVLESAAGFHDQLVNDPVLEVLLQDQGTTVLGHVEVPVPFNDISFCKRDGLLRRWLFSKGTMVGQGYMYHLHF